MNTNNIIYNSDGINIYQDKKQDFKLSINKNLKHIKSNIIKDNDIKFDTKKENIIYNSDGFIPDILNRFENEETYKIKIKTNQENISSKVTL